MRRTRIYRVEIEVDSRISDARMIKALARVLEHARDVDIAGAEVLNHDDTGQLHVIKL